MLKPAGVRRGEFVPGAEGFRLAKAKCSAEIHNANASVEQGWRQFSGNFVRGGKKRSAGVTRKDGIHRKRTKGSFAPSAELRKKLREALRAVGFAHVEDRRPKLKVVK